MNPVSCVTKIGILMIIKLGQVSMSIQAIVTEIFYISNHWIFYLKPLTMTVQCQYFALVGLELKFLAFCWWPPEARGPTSKACRVRAPD